MTHCSRHFVKYVIYIFTFLFMLTSLSSCVLVSTSPPVELYWHVRIEGIISPYFAYDDETGNLYIRGKGSTGTNVVAVNISRKEVLWKKFYFSGMAAMPNTVEVYGDKVYLLQSAKTADQTPGLVALNKYTGDLVWKFPFSGYDVSNGFALHNGYIYAFDCRGNKFYKIDADTGSEIWSVSVPTVFDTKPVVDEELGLVYFGTTTRWENEQDPPPPEIYAVDMETGRTVWKYEIDNRGWFDDINSVPVIYGDSIYAAGFKGKVVRIRKATGELVWQTRLMAKEGFAYQPGWGGRLWVYDGKLEMVLTSGIIVALNIDNGDIVWAKDVSNTTASLMDLYLQDGRIYVHGWGPNIGCYSAETGEKIWVYSPPDSDQRVGGAPMKVGDYVVDGDVWYNFYVLKER